MIESLVESEDKVVFFRWKPKPGLLTIKPFKVYHLKENFDILAF